MIKYKQLKVSGIPRLTLTFLHEVVMDMLGDIKNVDCNIGIFLSDKEMLLKLNSRVKSAILQHKFCMVGTCNQRVVENKSLNIKVFFDTIKKTKKAADNVGRGMSLNYAIFSDVSDVPDDICITQLGNMVYAMSRTEGIVFVCSSGDCPDITDLGTSHHINSDTNKHNLRG